MADTDQPPPNEASASLPEALPGSADDAIPPSINLLILITGSIAAIKTGLLLDQLHNERCHIRIAATTSAFHFLKRAQPSRTGIPFQSILADQQEWDGWQAINDAVVHIELRKWADLAVIAPLDANSLAKIATGQCNNLVTCVMRAWEVGQKPVIVCPAMNTAMWTHPITAQQISELRRWYAAPGRAAADEERKASGGLEELPQTLEEAMFQIIGPVSKRLGCGDIGMGGMASVEVIAKSVCQTMALLRAKKKEQMAQEGFSSDVAGPAPDAVCASNGGMMGEPPMAT